MLRKRRPFTSATSIRRSTPSVNASSEPTRSCAVDAEVEREVVAGAGGNADERKVVREGGRGDDGERAVAAGGAERVGAARHGVVDQRREVVVRAQDDRVDAELARPLGEAGARGLAAAGPRVDEEDRPLRRSAACQHGRVTRRDVTGATFEVARRVDRDRARGRRSASRQPR